MGYMIFSMCRLSRCLYVCIYRVRTYELYINTIGIIGSCEIFLVPTERKPPANQCQPEDERRRRQNAEKMQPSTPAAPAAAPCPAMGFSQSLGLAVRTGGGLVARRDGVLIGPADRRARTGRSQSSAGLRHRRGGSASWWRFRLPLFPDLQGAQRFDADGPRRHALGPAKAELTGSHQHGCSQRAA
jgi:hypothetical protein